MPKLSKGEKLAAPHPKPLISGDVELAEFIAWRAQVLKFFTEELGLDQNHPYINGPNLKEHMKGCVYRNWDVNPIMAVLQSVKEEVVEGKLQISINGQGEEVNKKSLEFLHKLYEMTGGNESQGKLMDDIAESLDFGKILTSRIWKNLIQEELTKMMGTGIIGITHKGINAVKEELSSQDVPAKADIFIVHGKDTEAKYRLKSLLRDWGLNPIILHERPNRGRAIIEKLEDHSDEVRSAIVLLTPDDEGRLAGSSDWKLRARQNVVFELGYFFAKLGRDKVICLHKGDIELPSDMSGIIYISFDSDLQKEVYSELRKELKAIGFAIHD